MGRNCCITRVLNPSGPRFDTREAVPESLPGGAEHSLIDAFEILKFSKRCNALT
jgi:hypothetical protein